MTADNSTLFDRLIGERGHLVHKLKAQDTTGRWAYYFVYVPPHRERAFLAAIESGGNIDIEDYGDILASSYGEAPDPKVRDYLKQRYGFDV